MRRTTRDSVHLFWPWCRQERGGIIKAEPRVDATEAHNRVVAPRKSAADWLRVCVELFSYPVDGTLRECADNVRLCAAHWDSNRTHTVAAAGVTWLECTMLPDNQEAWAEAIIHLLASKPDIDASKEDLSGVDA